MNAIQKLKKSFLLFVLCCIFLNSSGQSVKVLDGYVYLHIYPVIYGNSQSDIYGIAGDVREIFVDKGFGYISDFTDPRQRSQLVVDNPCIVLYCAVSHDSPALYTSAELTLTFTNCYNQLVYKTSSKTGISGSYEKRFSIAVDKALADFKAHLYAYNPRLTPLVVYPEVEKTNETEESIRSYLSVHSLDPIEGIYKSYQSENMQYYKIGIIRVGDVFKAILLESEFSQWKPGEIKAVFEQSSISGLYAVKWMMGNKTPFETFARMENPAVLLIEFKNQSNEATESRYIKMFPSLSEREIAKGESPIMSGSGFFVSGDGIIATNAHVVADADHIQIVLGDEFGDRIYDASVALVDIQNDIALLSIDDPDFISLSKLPFRIIDDADIGERVYTIGYPLNDVMGSNYKVTDGIISAKSGIDDDERYYQISVPLQPGNSGGPLFNSDGNVIGITSARLNGQAVGTQVENVGYAIKSSYLIDLYESLPDMKVYPGTSQITMKQLQHQVKILKNYVVLIKAY